MQLTRRVRGRIEFARGGGATLSAVKARLIVNPVAGRDAAGGFLESINARLRPHFRSLDIVITAASGDARAAAKEAAGAGYSVILAAGGDGTLNEVLNGIAAVDGGLARVTSGVIPLGTGNDFARALGLPPEVEPAVAAVLSEETRAVDLGCVSGQYFVNTSAGGFVAEVSEAVDPSLKSLAGRFAYLIGGAQVLWDYDPVGARACGSQRRRGRWRGSCRCSSLRSAMRRALAAAA